MDVCNLHRVTTSRNACGVNGFNGNGTIGKLLMDIPSARKIHAVELAELSASYLLDIATHRPPPIRTKVTLHKQASSVPLTLISPQSIVSISIVVSNALQ
ncbi:hypothetical protein PGTUg99_004349 [Puccinia graminis f. sp. tritici]|uniref:Uncharacterized protein n=1 Tax=Puccinia graminis f. sp. tritici TaxID=56615 RepID=A0A5B0SA65_PUCGR|nr:hypothetical protein PGTUg99_004349 [Puccinia graminis f. sp. tritici]